MNHHSNPASRKIDRGAVGKALLNGDPQTYAAFGLDTQALSSFAKLAGALVSVGRLENARVLYEGLTAIAPASAAGPEGLGIIALLIGDTAAAVDHLTFASQQTDAGADTFARLAEALIARKRFPEAEAAIARTLALDPAGSSAGGRQAILLQPFVAELKAGIVEPPPA